MRCSITLPVLTCTQEWASCLRILLKTYSCTLCAAGASNQTVKDVKTDPSGSVDVETQKRDDKMKKATNDNSSDLDGGSAKMDQSRNSQSSEEGTAMQVENRLKDAAVNSEGNIDSKHASDAKTVDGAITGDGAKNVDGAKAVDDDEETMELESMPTKHSLKRRRGRPKKLDLNIETAVQDNKRQ